jgi:hypothetical protein
MAYELGFTLLYGMYIFCILLVLLLTYIVIEQQQKRLSCYCVVNILSLLDPTAGGVVIPNGQHHLCVW